MSSPSENDLVDEPAVQPPPDTMMIEALRRVREHKARNPNKHLLLQQPSKSDTTP